VPATRRPPDQYLDLDDATFDVFAIAAADAAAADADDVPVEEERNLRSRRRRGGPRTPFPLLPIIAVCAGVGIAYVAQTAHLTQATYQATNLAAQQSELQRENTRLGEQLDQLRSTARIDAAAQQLGMKAPVRWAYVPASTVRVTVPPAPGTTGPLQAPRDAVQTLVAALMGQFGTTEAEAASP
jgi:cell division protein FtsL